MIVKWGIFLSFKIGLIKSGRETWSKFSLIPMPDCNSLLSIWNFAGNLYALTEKELQIYWKTVFYSHLETCSQISQSMAACFLLFTGCILANVSTCVKLFAMARTNTALFSPHALVSAQTTWWDTDGLVVAEQWVHVWTRLDLLAGQSHCHDVPEMWDLLQHTPVDCTSSHPVFTISFMRSGRIQYKREII